MGGQFEFGNEFRHLFERDQFGLVARFLSQLHACRQVTPKLIRERDAQAPVLMKGDGVTGPLFEVLEKLDTVLIELQQLAVGRQC